MNAAVINKFVNGFPTTWKSKLVNSFALPSTEGEEECSTPAVQGKEELPASIAQGRRESSRPYIGEGEELTAQPRRSSRHQARQQSALFANDDEVRMSRTPLETKSLHSNNADGKGAATPTASLISSGASKLAGERAARITEAHPTRRATAAKSTPERKPSATHGKQSFKSQTPAPMPSPQGRMLTRKSAAAAKSSTREEGRSKEQSIPIYKPHSRKTYASNSHSTENASRQVSARKQSPPASRLHPPPSTPAPPSKRTRSSDPKSKSQPSLTASTTHKHNSTASASPSKRAQKATIRVTRSTRSRSGPQPSASSAITPKATSLAAKLRTAQEEKKARRSRRVAFAEVREETQASVAAKAPPATPEANRRLTNAVLSTPAIREKRTTGAREGWTNGQLKAYERARNSVAADEVDYWGMVASGIEGKNAEECRKLWESTWTSPQVETRHKKEMQKERTPEMIVGLQRARKTARGRGTGKFRTRARLLAEKVASGVEDEILEPLVLEREGVQTPKNIERMEAGTPGTVVREKKRGLEEAGRMETPEILKRGRSVGFKEADQYVGGFWRRIGRKRKEEGNAEVGEEDKSNGMENNTCDYSDEEPFF